MECSSRQFNFCLLCYETLLEKTPNGCICDRHTEDRIQTIYIGLNIKIQHIPEIKDNGNVYADYFR